MLRVLKDLIHKIYTNFRLDFNFIILKNLRFTERIKYIFNKYYCILINRREINYLDKIFTYDNRFVPAILQSYPKEIFDIDKAIDLIKVKRIIDIGANIAQFSFTLKKFFPHIYIHLNQTKKYFHY